MPRILIAFLIGILFGGSVVAFYRVDLARNQHKVGINSGKLLAQHEIMKSIQEKLGSDYSEKDGYNPLFELKADAVVIVERNGIKTLRVYQDNSKNE